MSSQVRHFCFTYNNYNKELWWQKSLVERLTALGANYYIWGEEIAPSTGTPHLQGYVQLEKRKAFNVVTKSLPGCHISICRGSSQDNVNYCNKECSNVVEYGILRTIARGRAKQAQDWDILLGLAESGQLEEIRMNHPREWLLYHRTWKQIYIDNLRSKPVERTCLWLYGKPGVGKSRAIQSLFPDAYWKNANKWWDGYKGQRTVVIDDLDSPVLFSYLKRWADRYKLVGEVKGGAIDLTYQCLVVTSNFHPGELGSQDLQVAGVTIEAVERRFLIAEAIEWLPDQDDLLIKVKGLGVSEHIPFPPGCIPLKEYMTMSLPFDCEELFPIVWYD